MVTLSEWEHEIERLRADLGPLESMRIRWRFKSSIRPAASLLELVAGAGSDERLIISLFPMTASPGCRAQGEVEVAADRRIQRTPQGAEVLVAGIPEPGHAVVVVAGGHEFWPVYPVTLGLRVAKL